MKPLCLILLTYFVMVSSSVSAQNIEAGGASVSLDFRVNPIVTQAQSLSLATLGINTSGRGAELFEIIIQNTSGTAQNNLYLRIEVSTSRFGKIAEIFSNSGMPFSLMPAQVIVATNNTLSRGLSGIPEGSLNARLTSNGERFLSSFEGSTSLPDEVYTLSVKVLEGDHEPGRGRIIAYVADVVGAVPIQNVVDFELLLPGGPVGSRDQVTSLNPTFRWDGPINQTYRLILVEDIGQSPLSLIQGALSTEPVQGPGATGSRLLEYEIADVLIRGTSWQFPVGGIRALQPGRRYFWQIFARVSTPTGFEERPSSIFEFTIPAASESRAPVVQSTQVTPVISGISFNLGAQLLSLIDQGYEITSIELDGIRYTGPAMMAILEDFANGVQTGTIQLVSP